MLKNVKRNEENIEIGIKAYWTVNGEINVYFILSEFVLSKIHISL